MNRDDARPAVRIVPADQATRTRIRELAERPLPLDEWRARLAIPLTEQEHEGTMELVRWFTRRYPTPAARLAYTRRAYRRWLGG